VIRRRYRPREGIVCSAIYRSHATLPFFLKKQTQESQYEMEQTQRIVDSIYRAVDELNQQMPSERQLDKSVDTALFGKSTKLDSLALVNLIVATEQNIEEEFGTTVTLADEKAMSQKNSPFKTIGTLTEYIALLLTENGNG